MRYIVIDSIILLLQFTVIICDGLILLMFYKSKQLYRNTAHRLLLLMTITDFLHAATILPYTIYMTIGCIPDFIDLDPYFMMISSTPLTIQLKIKLILTAAIASQRALALFCPISYRRIRSALYATMSLSSAILIACVDLLLEFTLSPIQESPGCGTIGCFVSDPFLRYWGTSNMALGGVIIAISTIIIFKLQKMGKKSQSNTFSTRDANVYAQASRTSAGILLTTVLFLTLPSVCAGLMELFGYSIFRRVGPFYIVGLFCADRLINLEKISKKYHSMSYLIIDCIILLLQFAVINCDGLILLMFLKSKQLYRSTAHRLMLLMAITDILHALTTLPYTIYMTIFCVTVPINLDPYVMVVSSTPLIIQLKIKLTLTAAVALQRALALYSPIYYRSVSSAWYAITSLLLGILLACTDLMLEFALSPIKESPNCGTIGCFVSEQFLYYWGTSNMALGIIIIVFMFMVLFKLQVIDKKPASSTSYFARETNKYAQASRTSVGILLTTVFFLTLPSVGAGFMEMINYSIFRKVGPFYTVGLLCAATSNAIVHMTLDRDLRILLNRFIACNLTTQVRVFPSTVVHTHS